MNEEIKSILKMVESGKISAEEGQKLIESIGKKDSEVTTNYVPSTKKFIHIQVLDDDDDTKVNINFPLNLARTMLKLGTIKNQIKVNANDIDIDFDEIIRLIEDNAEGEIVNIESDSAKVRIWID